MEININVSVILPTLNAGVYLPEWLNRIGSQTLVPYEIIIVDSMSDDNTPQLAEEHGIKVLSIHRSTFDHGGTRNYAASHATGDILVFTTQDAIPADDTFIEFLVRPFLDPRVGAVYGRQVARPEADPIERLTREFNYPELSKRKKLEDLNELGIKTFFFSDVCSAIRKEAFDKVGGFQEPIILNEDMIIAARCLLHGYEVQYAADARVIHSHNYTLLQQFRRHFDIGVSLRMNDWLLKYAKPEGEGLRKLKTTLRHLTPPRMWRWLPQWCAEIIVKFIGYRMGLSYRILPKTLLTKCTMHIFFWNRLPNHEKNLPN